MAQYARPASDLQKEWNTSTGTDHYALIDEESPADGDYLVEWVLGDTDKFSTTNVTDPGIHTGHIIRVRGKVTEVTGEMQVHLYDGVTLIKSWTPSLDVAYGTDSYTLSEGEAANIGDYTDLRLWLEVTLVDEDETIYVSWLEFEVPDAAPAFEYKDVPLLVSIESEDIYKDVPLKASVESEDIHKDVSLKTSIESADEYKDIPVKTSIESADIYKDVSLKVSLYTYQITGVTKDNAGSPLASCEVFLVKDEGSNVFSFKAHTTSDGTGNYTFTNIIDNDANYQLIAWKDDAPHVFDVTDWVIQPETT